jgi:hypothetical protein
VLGTINYHTFKSNPRGKSYSNSVQIIDAGEPWPPIWYKSTPAYTYEMHERDSIENHIHFDQIGAPEVNSGVLSYLDIAPRAVNDTGESAERQFDFLFIEFNKKMEAADTVVSRITHRTANGRIENLAVVRKDSILDLSGITGNPGDNAVASRFWVLEVRDEKNNLLRVWNPIYTLDPKLFEVKEKLVKRASSNGLRISWMKLAKPSWDHDGGILYSLQNGEGDLRGLTANGSVGKISGGDFQSQWHIDCFGAAFTPNADTLQCGSPFDLQFEGSNDTAWIYSFYDRGLDNESPARGALIVENKKTSKLSFVKYIKPKNIFWVSGHGGFDYNPANGNFILEYGVFEEADTSRADFRPAFEYGRADTTCAVFQLPRENYTFGMHRLENWPVPPRPEIKYDGKKLEAVGEMTDWTWYKLEGINGVKPRKIGRGASIVPKEGGIYCVSAPYGTGYAVSRSFEVKKQ